MGEISLRHIPDLSDASGIADFSDSSFQIPAAAHIADDLLADATIDFFNNANDALNTPAPLSRPSVQPPLTLAELTPRSKPVRAAPVRSSLRPRPGITTPFRHAVATELSTALFEDLSPFRKQDPSFQIPPAQTQEDLLKADDAANFLGAEEPSVDRSPLRPPVSLTLTQLTPCPLKSQSSSHASPQLSDPMSIESVPSRPANGLTSVERSPQVDAVSSNGESSAAPTTAIAPNISDSVPELTGHDHPDVVPRKGKSKALPATKLIERHKRLMSGDVSKRKRVLPSAAVTKPAKPKSLTASLARRLSNPGRKTLSAGRRRPLQGTSTSTDAVEPDGSMAGKGSQPIPCANIEPTRYGGLADTLMSYGQRLIAHECRQEERVGTGDGTKTETPGDPAQMSKSKVDGALLVVSTDGPARRQGAESIPDPGYLTLSQLSPQKYAVAQSSSAILNSQHIDVDTPGPTFDQLPPPTIASSDCPPSPMRHSIKRAASSADEPQARSRKRSKTTSVPSALMTSKEDNPALQPSRARNAQAATTSSGPLGGHRPRRVVSATVSVTGGNRAAKTDGARKPGTLPSRSLSHAVPGGEDGGVTLKASDSRPGLSFKGIRDVATSSGNSRSGHRSHRENLLSGQDRSTDEQKAGRSASSTSNRPPAHSLAAKPTQPMAFQFATSTRFPARSSKPELERSAGGSVKRSRGHAYSIPDFKALHGAQESVLVQKRAEIHVTVPVEFDLATVTRAHEREKFEEARRAREQELERQAEERRRQREMEEEAEIRELRRRAVPKANEVPEWYAFAPKRTKGKLGDVGVGVDAGRVN